MLRLFLFCEISVPKGKGTKRSRDFSVRVFPLLFIYFQVVRFSLKKKKKKKTEAIGTLRKRSSRRFPLSSRVGQYTRHQLKLCPIRSSASSRTLLRM